MIGNVIIFYAGPAPRPAGRYNHVVEVKHSASHLVDCMCCKIFLSDIYGQPIRQIGVVLVW